MARQFKVLNRITNRNDIINRYFDDINAIGNKISEDEEYELAVKAATGDDVAREKLIHANLRFVISVAKAYANKDARLEDLINEGNYGLVEASYKFDPTTGFKFISYAVWHIRKEIFKYMTRYSRIVRLPQHRVTELAKIDKAMQRVMMREQIEPTISMILDELDASGTPMSEDVVINILNTNASVTPLEGNSTNPDDPKPLNWISSKDNHPMDLIIKNDFEKIKKELFKNLTYNEQYILTKRLGLDGKDSESFRSIGEYLGKSGQTVTNYYSIILRKLKYRAKEINYTLDNYG